MLIKKISFMRTIAFLLCSLSFVATPIHHHHHIYEADVTVVRLRQDTTDIKKYVTERISSDLKKAKRWGRWMANKAAGISYYAFDAIPFEFFADNRAIDEVFKRLDDGVAYIQETKETFKRSFMGGKKKLNQSQLAEFLYNHAIDNVHVTAEQKAVLRKDPLKMDEFVRRGIVKRDEYMYVTLLNFVVRYYLEHEAKHK
jgi:hypothetical protein